MVGLYQVSMDHPVLDLPIGHQRPCHQSRIALGVADPLMESLLVSETPSCHTEAVGLHIVPPLLHSRVGKP